ncbi:MAG TPA: uroporphyrinogen decarboxylase family protein [Limnochordia bacterium]|nr:uroporphyrinogen decarboxylase family protein [Limnochordia bacterium]HXK96787.1 uroporphyrinogen decarboxylase family protein [Limnochordia bacterium]
MDPKERFFATVERRPVDRPASWLGLPVPEACERLFAYFDVGDIDELKLKIGDDIYPVEIPYDAPDSKAIYTALQFAKKANTPDQRTLTAPGFFEDYSDPSRVDDFNWPDPAKHIDPDRCRRAVEAAPPGHPIMGVLWSAHFQDACSAFGMETALVKMLIEPEMFRAVIDRITQFYLEANEIFYSATKGKLDAILIGNDFGSQQGLMVSPDAIREFVMPGTRKFIEQAKSYGLKVIYHSCGSIYPVIPDLIAAGVDVIHPIQALAKDMEPERLKRDFGDKVSFCGGVDAQWLLINGTPKQVKDKVQELKRIFPTGLIISPSHEAILPDVDPANIEALFEAVKEPV